MYYPLLARHHLPNSKLLTSVGSHEHDLWWQNTLARILFILSRADAPLTKKENFGTSLSKSRISDPFCRTSGAQNMAIKFFFSGSKAARTSYRSFVRSSVNMQGGTHTHAASRLKFTSPGSDIVLPSSLNESNWKIETMVDSGAPVSNTLVHRLIMYSTSSILIRIWSAPLMAFGAAAKEAYLCSLC